MQEDAIYVIFSSTKTGMGRVVRTATRNRYNHVSLSFDKEGREMYSFARLHKDEPLYGGLTPESAMRYLSERGPADVKICRVPASREQVEAVKKNLASMLSEQDKHIYNTAAALSSVIGKKVQIPKSHTCVTFVQEMLSNADIMRGDMPPTIRALEQKIEKYAEYEGPMRTGSNEWGGDRYNETESMRHGVYVTARHFVRLAKRLLTGKA